MLGVFLASTTWALAQVSVELVLDQEQFLLDESLPVRVRVANRSGQTLRLGEEKDWLTFTIESRDGYVVAPLREMTLEGEQAVESSLVASRRVDLMPYYDLSKPGRYKIRAAVKIKQWDDQFSSTAKEFEISRGTKIWEQEFGVPTASGPPEARRYALEQANYVKRMMLYVRLTDLSEHRVFRVFPAGPLLSFSRPEARIDRESNLHLLFQTGARSFLYEVVNPDGDLIERQTHDYTSTRPALRSGEDGRTSVVGGIRHTNLNDIPTLSTPTITNEIKTPKS